MGGRSLGHADPFEKGGRGVTRLIGCALKEPPLRWVGSGGARWIGRTLEGTPWLVVSLAWSWHWKELHGCGVTRLALEEATGRGGTCLVAQTLEEPRRDGWSWCHSLSRPSSNITL